MQQYTISVADIVRANGLSCPPDKINIVFEQPECADVVCIQNASTITISIPDGCDQKCFYGVASCDVDCDTCGDMRVEICPCMDNTGCGPCSICDPVKHICISNCGPGKICSEECGGCADCDSETPCPGDKVCQNCKCECPTDRPYTGPNGTCIDCRDKNDCPPCHECTPTGCKPIVCTTGVCNDEKGCVECNSKTDCVGANKCCDGNNKCVCCPGFVKDQDGNCIQIDCTKDSDCGDCQSCDIASGKCNPTICPPGTVCVKDGCLPICDCDSPLCDTSNACIRLNESTCYCSSCVGSCANGEPCGPGCYCDKTDGKCKPNPCGGSCTNGTDCGPGCGCNKLTGQCEPCGSVPCGTPCNNLLGCGCPDGTNCSDLPDCGGDCTNGSDCPPGCGCFQGKCVNCANFTCADCAGVDGCKCTDGVNCDSDPDRGCKDKAEFIKNQENCSLTAKFDIKAPCSCPVITAGVIATNFGTNQVEIEIDPIEVLSRAAGTGGLFTSFRVELRKGNVSNVGLFGSLPLLNDTTNQDVLENEMPTSGQVKATVYAIYRQGTITLPRVQVSNPTTVSIGNKTSVYFTNLSLGLFSSNGRVLISYEVEFEVSSKLAFPNSCNYNVTNLFKVKGNVSVNNGIYSTTVSNNTVLHIKNLQSNDLRNPEIIWSKSKTNSFSKENIFRKVYVPKGQDGTYQDTLYGPGKIPTGNPYPLSTPQGELWNGYNYKVSSSCSCDEASIDNLLFCNVDKLKYEFKNKNCQTSIQITDNFIPCPINDIHSKFNELGYTIPDDTEMRYDLFFNNKIAYQWKGSLNAGLVITSPETINTVTIVQFLGDIEVCRQNYKHPYVLPNPIISFNCNNVDDNSVVSITVNQEVGDPKINKIKFGIKGGQYFSQFEVNGVFTSPVTKNIPKNLFGNSVLVAHFTFTNGCSKEIELPKCSNEVIATPVPSKYAYGICNPSGGNPKIVVDAFGFDTSNVKYSINGGPLQTSNEFTDKPAGTYNIVVNDGISIGTTTVVIENPITPEVYLEDDSICIGGSTKLVIKAETGTTFNINTPGSSFTAITNGGIYELNIPYSPTAEGNYTVTLVSTPNGQICPLFSKTVALAVGGQNYIPTIEIEPGSYCVGSPIRFRILNGGSSQFSVTSNGTGAITNVIVAGSEYTGLYTPNVPNGQIAILGLVGDTCNTTTNPVVNVTTTVGPTITSSNAICLPNNTITVTVNTVNATSVKIQNVDATESAPGSGIWERTGITGLTNATIVVSNGSCVLNSTIEIPNCSCPSGELLIVSDGNICGSGNAEFNYDNFINQSPDSTWNYFWETLNIGTWVQTGIETVFNPMSTPTFTYGLAQNQSVTARLVLINTVNGCRYNSNEISVTASTALPKPAITISPIPALVGNTVTFNTNSGYSNYQWTVNGNPVGTNSSSYTYTPTVVGSVTVTVTVTNSSGCMASSDAVNFTIGANCTDIPLVYIPSGVCSDIQIQVTNTVGVSINYTATGTGSLGTVINQTGVVPGSNIILIDTDILDPSEQVTSLNFVLTYQQGANPICTINKIVSLTYTRCSIDGSILNPTGSYTLQGCTSNIWRYNPAISFAFGCAPVNVPIQLFIEYFVTNGVDTDLVLTRSYVYTPLTPACTNALVYLVGSGLAGINLVDYGGDTVTLTAIAYIGTDNTGTNIGTSTIGTGIVLPASC